MSKDMETFLEVAEWEDYSSAEFGFLARRRPEGLFPVHGFVILSPQTPGSPQEFLSESKDLVVIRGCNPASDLRESLCRSEGGELNLGSHTLQIRTVEAERQPSWSFWEKRQSGRERIGWPASMLRVGLSGIPEVMAPLDWHSLDEHFGFLEPYPFPSLNAAVRWLSPALDLVGNAHLDVYAPVWARLRTPELNLSSGHVRVVIESSLDAAVPMHVVFLSQESTSPPISIPRERWSTEDGESIASASLKPGTGSVDVSLRVRGRVVWSETTFAPSVALQAHAGLAGGTAWLLRLLEPSGKDRAKDFERGIVALLGLAGIPAIPYGHDGLDYYSDLIAFPTPTCLIVADCTTETPSPDKIAKLRGRTTQLCERLRTRPEIAKAISVVFHPLNVGVMPQEIQDKAQELGVTLVWGERLAGFADLVFSGESPRRIVSLLRHGL